MTAGELKKALENVPDEVEVLRDGGFDHSYLPIHWGSEVTVGYFKKENHYVEWFGFDHAGEGEEPRNAFVVGCG